MVFTNMYTLFRTRWTEIRIGAGPIMQETVCVTERKIASTNKGIVTEARQFTMEKYLSISCVFIIYLNVE